MTTPARDLSFADAPFILRESRQREAVTSMRLAVDLQWSSAWLAENCYGDGFDRHPLLAGSESCAVDTSVTMTGLIVDGRGVHSQATFCAERGPRVPTIPATYSRLARVIDADATRPCATQRGGFGCHSCEPGQ
jgi:hypothetical protein